MNRVLGTVILNTTRTGLPHLLVTIFEANSTLKSSSFGADYTKETDETHWKRLGSALTRTQGEFEFLYEYDEQDDHHEKTLNLVLVVTKPNENCNVEQDYKSRIATCMRSNVSSSESFLLVVDIKKLDGAGAPESERELNDVIEEQRNNAKRQELIRAESNRILVEKLEKRKKFERLAATKFQTFLSALSSVSPTRHNSEDGRYVARGESVEAANLLSIQDGIRKLVNNTKVEGRASLTEEQAAAFKDPTGVFIQGIPETTIKPLLRPQKQGGNPGLINTRQPRLLCRDQPDDPCVKVLEGEEPDQIEVAIKPEPIALPADIPILIENLVKNMTSPESPSVFTVHTRAGVEDVQQGVTGFSLHSGPADTPAIHDFHHLQIAFEHVWKELFDGNIENIAKDLYTDLVELGLDPNEYLVDLEEMNISVPAPQQSNGSANTPSEPYSLVITLFDILPEQWQALTFEQQIELSKIANGLQVQYDELVSVDSPRPFEFWKTTEPAFFKDGNGFLLAWKREQIRQLRHKGQTLIGYANHKLETPDNFVQFHPLLKKLEDAMKEPYRFSIYAANRFQRSVNFGIVATYRQKWEPVNYQVGELIKTVPLSPKEVRRYTRKVSVRTSRSEKEVQNNLHARRSESTETGRAETSIFQKAQNKTNFQMSAEGGFNMEFVHAKGSTAFQQDAATESQEVKKEFRESVFKAAEEYKSERNTEVNVSTGEDTSFEESGEISNPNDEITVTYLFYELQQRYRISEKIHRVTPIVLVAQEFPTPNQINEDWIITHDWILRRVILDDSFLPAMNYLVSKVVGDEVSLQVMYENLQQKRRIADELKEELIELRSLSESRYAAFQKSIERRALVIEEEEEDDGGIIPMPVGFIPGGSDASPDAARVREDAARDAHERAMKQEKEVLARLERETTSLNALTEAYTKSLSEHLNRKQQIARLRIHIKSNIMYYMQAIWSHEPPDQRFFRLHEVRVPKLEGEMTYNLEVDPDAIPMPPDWTPQYRLVVECELDLNTESQTLEEVADLDKLLGFKGNYMMFPLKKSNSLTDFMMIPYLDGVMGIRDPDPLGNWTVHEFLDYVCCLRRKLSKVAFDRLLPALQAAYQQLVNAPHPDGDEVVIPTDSLFIEALPGVHPILEDFKLFHRVMDVKKVQADVRAKEFENIRAAARLLAGEREDPTIEKKVVIEGGSGVVISPEDT